MKEGSLTKKALGIIQNRGQSGAAQARQKILKTQYDDGAVAEALHYYAKAVLPKVLPIFPALIVLSSKAVGVIPENAEKVAAALMQITASGDIHDDIVDNSTEKFGRKTLVGKYGKDIALLAGDALLTQGVTELQNECANLPWAQRKVIADCIAASMVEIIKAEAAENSLWHKSNVSPKEFLEVIRLKGGVAELHCRIGGLIGGGTQEAVEQSGTSR